MLESLAFAAPWGLTALAVLPVIWWLLRVTPPAPKRLVFPAARLLFDLRHEEETPARTPLWLIVLRLAIATLIIVALAQPLLNPGTRLAGDGPLIVVVDNGWAAARRWDQRQTALDEVFDKAERGERSVIVVTTAPGADGTVAVSRLMRAAEARRLAQAIEPRPWAVDRGAALEALAGLSLDAGADVIWLSDGVIATSKEEEDAGEAGGPDAFAAALARLGRLQVMTDPALDRARALLPPLAEPGALTLRLLRAADTVAETLWLRASSEDGALLTRQEIRFEAGVSSASAVIEAPAELRNRIVRLDIEGENSAGAVVLLDERWRRRPVGLVSGSSIETNQPLLSELFYLERALSPFSEVRRAELRELLQRPLAVLVLADLAKVIGEDRALLVDWLEAGGVLIRFAGQRLAEGADDLVPVTLRGGGRVLGGALSWSEPARLSAFDKDSPFAGLTIPDDVRVRRQVLAEPSLDLAAKTWAQLADGTPLVTAERRGSGWLVLIHTTANTAWSNLAISGLFVEMLQRLAALSLGVTGEHDDRALAPLRTLDGFGRLVEPPDDARALAADDVAAAVAGPRHPPGFYGAQGTRRALNLGAGIAGLRPLGALPDGAAHRVYGEAGEIDLMPWLLSAAIVLALVDLVAGLMLRGLLHFRRRAAAAAALLLFAATPAAAQEAQDADAFYLKATLEMRLAYVITGDSAIDEISRAGLAGLSMVLKARTSIEPAEPMAIDVETDELIFFPLIYWPVTETQRTLSPSALARLDHYLKTGGIVLFDTRDRNAGLSQRAGGFGPGARRLRVMLEGLNIPPLQPVPAEHVLTRSFYLLQDFPGRWAGGRLWVERHEGGINDGVSSLIVGNHDWAAVWAMDERRRPMFAAVPGGERQREMAYRFGVNLVMYAMTGNYKADQVHLPAILERLGQ